MLRPSTTAPEGGDALPSELNRLGRAVWPADGDEHRLHLRASAAGDDAERYLVLPDLRSPRFLLPLEARPRARMDLLLRYNRLRSDPRRAARSVLAPLVRAGLPRPRPGHNVLYAATDDTSLLAAVASVTGVAAGDLVLSTGVRPGAGPTRPTLNISDRDGVPHAFVKVAVTARQRESLEREHDVARAFQHDPAPGLLVPRPLFKISWGDALLVGVEPLPVEVRRVRPSHRRQVQPWLDRLVASRPRTALAVASSPWTRRLQDTSATLPDPWRDPVGETVARLTTELGGHVVEHGIRHGDWSPWNLAWLGDSRLAVWDWEYSEPLAPLGLDEWGWTFAHDVSVRGRTAWQAGRRLRAAAGATSSSAVAAELLLVDLLVRRAAQAAGGDSGAVTHARGLLRLLHERPASVPVRR